MRIPWNKGKTYEETFNKEKVRELKQKCSLARKGKKLSAVHRQALINSNLGKPAWNKGIPHKQETKDKIRKVLKGRSYKDLYGDKAEEIRKKHSYIMPQKSRNSISIKNTKRKWIDLECNFCHKKFKRKHKQKYCSKKCVYKARIGTHRSQETKDKIKKNCRGFLGRKHTAETIAKLKLARAKQVFPKKNTYIEVRLQNALSKLDIKYETHKKILGTPDIFIEPGICIFADGERWHSSDKIKIRDEFVNEELRKQGYIVLRFTGSKINYYLNECLDSIKNHLDL